MRRHLVAGLLAVLLVGGMAVVPLAAASDTAAPVPGATYTGRAADGAGVTFTISSDATLVTSYKIIGVYENGCAFYGEGDAGVWPGTPIVANKFDYELGSAISFQGTFTGPQSASGTFELQSPATSESPACDTGPVSWTATTTATPPGGPGSTGGGNGSGGGGSGGTGGNQHKPTWWTRVTFRRAGLKLLRGQVKSPKGACRAGRTVFLWMGKHRIASTKSKAAGKFSFALTPRVRGRAVRASAPASNMAAGSCAAGSSTFIKG